MIGPYGPYRLNPEFSFSDFANWGGAHNVGFTACVDACEGKRCVLDLGSHIGLVALPMAGKVGAEGVVYAFEPAEVNRRFLEDHLAKNGIANVRVCAALVGDEERDDVRFFEMDRATGQNSVVVKKMHDRYHETKRRQITLDGFCARENIAPEVIKIDVEGAELGVLEGARKILEQHRPIVFLSVHPTEIGLLGRSVDELEPFARSVGYGITTIAGEPVDRYTLSEYLMAPVRRNENP